MEHYYTMPFSKWPSMLWNPVISWSSPQMRALRIKWVSSSPTEMVIVMGDNEVWKHFREINQNSWRLFHRPFIRLRERRGKVFGTSFKNSWVSFALFRERKTCTLEKGKFFTEKQAETVLFEQNVIASQTNNNRRRHYEKSSNKLKEKKFKPKCRSNPKSKTLHMAGEYSHIPRIAFTSSIQFNDLLRKKYTLAVKFMTAYD